MADSKLEALAQAYREAWEWKYRAEQSSITAADDYAQNKADRDRQRRYQEAVRICLDASHKHLEAQMRLLRHIRER